MLWLAMGCSSCAISNMYIIFKLFFSCGVIWSLLYPFRSNRILCWSVFNIIQILWIVFCQTIDRFWLLFCELKKQKKHLQNNAYNYQKLLVVVFLWFQYFFKCLCLSFRLNQNRLFFRLFFLLFSFRSSFVLLFWFWYINIRNIIFSLLQVLVINMNAILGNNLLCINSFEYEIQLNKVEHENVYWCVDDTIIVVT